ncbi:transcription factor Adf-1-like [Maniola hyperantus]|uniref:transcription factor Adf-1-like n=1 Tax=Aphantopus hyperantus TaxID=2795564 RepID=UPI003748DD15
MRCRTLNYMKNVENVLLFRRSMRQRRGASAVKWGGVLPHSAASFSVQRCGVRCASRVCIMEFFEDNLIELVRNYPSLYKNKDKKHKSLIVKDNCWREIAEKLNKTPEECKNKWRNLRDNYRKNQNKKKTGSASFVSKYDDERLKFINDSFEERESISNLNPGNVLEVDEDNNLPVEICSGPTSSMPSSTPYSPCESISQQPSQEGHSITQNKTQGTSQVKKKKRESLVEEFRKNREERTNMLRQITEKGNTPVHTFFRSMADVVSQFPPDKIAQIRAQVCNIVTEMELLVLAQRETPSPQQSFNTPQHPIHAYNSQRETPSPQQSFNTPQHPIHAYNSQRVTPSPQQSFNTPQHPIHAYNSQRETPSPQQSFNTPQHPIHAYNSQRETPSPQQSFNIL